MAHLSWRSASSSREGTNDPSSTQLATSSRLNRAESIGEIVSDGIASPAPGGTSSGINGAQPNGEIGLLPSRDRTSPDTNRIFNSVSLHEPWCCPCIFGACTSTFTRIDTAYNGPDVFKVRELSNAEAYHLNRLQTHPWMLKLKGSRFFGDQLQKIKEWPKFFASAEKASLELRDGFVILWTTFIIAESLLAGVAIQPFITNIPGLSGLQFEVYGLVWMFALMFDMVGLTVTALFLGYLHALPGKLSYIWVCNMSTWIAIPVILVILGAVSSVVAMGYSSWVIYGYRVGITCVFVEGLVVIFAVVASVSGRKAWTDAQALN